MAAVVAGLSGATALGWKFALPAIRDQKAIGAARELVSYGLRDPSSAQYRNVAARAGAVCGEVNGKNAYGAYAGFKHFIVYDGAVTIEPELAPLAAGASVAALIASEAHNEFSGLWMMRCQSFLPKP